MTQTIDPCDTMRNNLIAAAVGLQQCKKTDGTEVLIPGTDKRILIGGDAYLAQMAVPAAASVGEVNALAPAVIALDAAIHKVLIAGDDGGDELSDAHLRKTLKQAQQVAYRALISIGIDQIPGAVNSLSAFLPAASTQPVGMTDSEGGHHD